MASVFKLLIHSSDVNCINGHYTVTASIEELKENGDVVNSPPETFGISHEEIQIKFGSDIKQALVKWRDNKIGPELKARHLLRQEAHKGIINWHGKKFDVAE